MASVVFDANALIALVDSKNPFHSWAMRTYLTLTGEDLHISSLTYAEVLVHPERAGKTSVFMKNLSKAGFRVEPLSDTDSVGLAKIRVTSKLKMPDAVVLHLAQSLGARIMTTDDQLIKAANNQKIRVINITR